MSDMPVVFTLQTNVFFLAEMMEFGHRMMAGKATS
jgi:hypothetical protein